MVVVHPKEEEFNPTIPEKEILTNGKIYRTSY